MVNTYPKVQQLSAVTVSSVFNPTAAPYGMNGIALLNESDHENLQSYRSMDEVEQDYDIDTDIWKSANAYFNALNSNNGLVQVISFDRNYGNNSGGAMNPPSTPNQPNDKKGDDK